MRSNWRGVFPAATTQFREDGRLDLEATARHLEALIGAGVQGLVMLGSLGENTTLAPEEKRRVVELATRTSAGRVPVLSGVAECSTAMACSYARDMEQLGADGLMVLPAMVYRSDPRETVAHFRAVARAGGLPILAYNNPVAYGVDITPAMFAELADEPAIVAIKESSADTRRITDLINSVGSRYVLFTGVDDLVLESVLLGAEGWIAGATLAFPREGQYLWELATSGQWEAARALYRWFLPLLHLDIGPKFIQKIKLAVQECGLGAEWVRMPRLPLAGAEREEVLAVIRRGLKTRPNPLAPLMADRPTLVRVIDSHTAGEPTRVVVEGGPDLGEGSVALLAQRFRAEHDRFRSALVNEPRGSDLLVGALLTRAADPACAAGALFFNNVGLLGMCGHGSIGVIATLAYLGRLRPGEHRLETPVGVVTARLHDDGRVSVRNVPSYRLLHAVKVEIPGHGAVTGDVAWGGNWFFLCEEHGQELSLANVEALTEFTWRFRLALREQGITGAGGEEIDHIELFGPPCRPDADSRNFVLCPGKAYDRSPCGTGTSAKLACLHAAGKLQPGQVWRQESLIGSLFEGSYDLVEGAVVPTITGTAFITAEARLILDPADPYCWGIG